MKAVVATGGSEADAQKAVGERVIPRHISSFAPGEYDKRVPGNVTKVYGDLKAGRY